jgi:kinetochore protein Nuf2
MAKGIFPQMSIPDIINALAGWGISVSPDQLKSPNSEFVESVYCACLHQVTDLNHDSLQDPVQNALEASQTEDKVFEYCVSCFSTLNSDITTRTFMCLL